MPAGLCDLASVPPLRPLPFMQEVHARGRGLTPDGMRAPCGSPGALLLAGKESLRGESGVAALR